MAAKKKAAKKKSKIQAKVRDTASAALEAGRARADQLKKRIKAAKKELREVRRQLKAAKKDAKKRIKAARAEASKRLARMNAVARRKRAALAKAIAPKPKPVAKEPVVQKGTPAPKPASTSIERLSVIRAAARVPIDTRLAPVKKPEAVVAAPTVTPTPAPAMKPTPPSRPN